MNNLKLSGKNFSATQKLIGASCEDISKVTGYSIEYVNNVFNGLELPSDEYTRKYTDYFISEVRRQYPSAKNLIDLEEEDMFYKFLKSGECENVKLSTRTLMLLVRKIMNSANK